MNVSDLMTSPARTCRADDVCSTAASLMWDSDCGCVPITGDDGTLLGIVTDRDLCMAAYTTGLPLGAIPVARAMSAPAHTCRTTDPVDVALETMRTFQLHRLPIVDADGGVVGLLSLTDLVQHHARQPKADSAAVFATLASVCRPRGEVPANTKPHSESTRTEEPVVTIQPATTATPKSTATAKPPAPKTPAKQTTTRKKASTRRAQR